MRKSYFILTAALIVLLSGSAFSNDYKALLDSSDYYKNIGNYGQSALFAEQAITEAEKSISREDSAFIGIIDRLLYLYSTLNDFDNCIKYARLDSLIKYKSVDKDPLTYIESLYLIEQVYEKFQKDREALNTCNDILKTVKKYNGADHIYYANAMKRKAIVQLYLGEFKEAAGLFDGAMKIYVKESGKYSADYYSAVYYKAYAFELAGDIETAAAYYEETLLVADSIYEISNQNYIATLQGIAKFYSENGMIAKADSLLNVLLENYKDVYGEKSAEYLGVLNQMSVFYVNAQMADKAENTLNKSMAISKELYGENSEEYLLSLDNLVNYYFKFGMLKESMYILKQEIDIYEKIKPPYDLLYLLAVKNLGTVQYRLGVYEEAETNFTKELGLRKQYYGDSTDAYLNSLYNLALFHKDINKTRQASSEMQEMIGLHRKYYSANDSIMIDIYYNAGSFYESIKQIDSAEYYYKELLEASKRYNGTDHPDYIIYSKILVDFYIKSGQNDKAEEVLNTILKKERRLFGKDSKQLAMSYKLLSQIDYQRRDYSKSGNSALKAVEILKNYPDDILYGSLLNQLAMIYDKQRNYAEAEKYYKGSANEYGRLRGINDLNYHNVLNNFANFYASFREFNKADSIYNIVAETQAKAYGLNNISLASTKIKQAYLFYDIRKYDIAIRYYSEAIDIYRKYYGAGNREFRMQLFNYASLLNKIDESVESEGACSELLNIYDSLKISRDTIYIWAMAVMADNMGKNGKFDKGVEMFGRAMETYKKLYPADDSTYAYLLSRIGSYYEDAHLYNESGDYYKQALEITGNKHGEQSYPYNKLLKIYSTMLMHSGNYKKSEQYISQVVNYYKKNYGPESAEYAKSMAVYANILMEAGKYSLAEESINESINILTKAEVKDSILIADYLNIKGLIFKKAGRFSESETIYRNVLEIKEKLNLKNTYSYAISLDNIANLYSEIGRNEKAGEYYFNAKEIFKKELGKDHLDYAISIQNLGTFYSSIKLYNLAEKYTKESLEIYRKHLGDEHLTTTIGMDNLAVIYGNTGKYDEAEKLYSTALKTRIKNYGRDHPSNGITLHNLAIIYEETGRSAIALKNIDDAIQIYREKLGDNSISLADVLAYKGVINQSMNKLKESEASFKQGLQIYIKNIEKFFPFFSENEKKQFYFTIKNKFEKFNSLAVKRYTESQEIAGDMYNYRMITKALLLNSTKKVRERILNSGNEKLVAKYKLWKDSKEYLAQLSVMDVESRRKTNINLDSLEDFANGLEKQLSEKSQLFAKEYERKAIKWEDVRKSLKENEAAVEIIRINLFEKKENKLYPGAKSIFRGDSIVYAALIIRPDTKNAPDMVLLKDGNKLEGKYYHSYRKLINLQRKKAINENEMKEYLAELYSKYWSEINGKLNNISKVYLSLDGVYNQINLNTLFNSETNKYLIEEVDLRILTTTKDLVLKRLSGSKDFGLNEENAGPKTSILFGNPKFNMPKEKYSEVISKLNNNYMHEAEEEFTYTDDIASLDTTVRGGISQLPGTKAEVNAIADYMEKSGWETYKYLAEDAIEEVLKSLNGPTILHIATHGKFLADVRDSSSRMIRGNTERYIRNPLLRSMLLFAGSENTLFSEENDRPELEDGVLTAYEAMNLNLDNTELVILSACETGLGEVINGEGVYGMQRAFRVAGANTLVMSLWSVSDKATRDLMVAFYRNWLAGMSKSDAFRKAQLDLKLKYPGFYYWGAFVMVGDGE